MPSAIDSGFLVNGAPVSKDRMRTALDAASNELEHAGYFTAAGGGVERRTAAKLDDALSVRDFGATGDGTTDDSAAFDRAIQAAAGGALHVPEGRYRVAVTTSDDVHLFGQGTLLARPGVSTILHNPSYGRDRAVSALTQDGWPSSSGPLHSRLATDTSGLAVGDIVQIHARERYSWLNSVWKSETAEIAAIDATTITLAHQLHDFDGSEAELNVRAFPKSRFVIDGLAFEAESDIDDSAVARVPTLDIRAVDRPIIRARCVSAYERFVLLRSCWLGEVDVETMALRDWPSAGGFGYGVDIQGACYGTRVRVHGTRCRHIVTGNIFKTSSFSDSLVHSYGRPRNVYVHDSVSLGSHGGAAFDTHEGCLHWIFQSCYAVNPRIDPNGEPLAAGFSDRGEGTIFSDCHVIGGTRGFRLNVNAIDFGGNTTLLNNCSARRLTGSGPRAISVTGSTSQPPRIEIDGFHMDASGNFARIGGDADMRIKNATIGPTFDVAFDIAGSNGVLSLENVTIDQRGATGTAAIRTRGACDIRVLGVHLDADGAPKPFVRNESSSAVELRIGHATSLSPFAWSHPSSRGAVNVSSIRREA